MSRREVFFDVETKNLFSDVGSRNPGDLGVSLTSVYVREVDESQKEISGKMYSFWEKELDKMWKFFQEADRIVGFNSLGFDIPALEPYALYPLGDLPHLDVLEHVRIAFGRRVKLDALLKDTLGTKKTDIGTNAVRYYRAGDKASLEKLRTYCEADVLLTRDLYDYGVSQKHLKFTDHWNTLRTIPVDFSYPQNEENASKQVGLF